MTKPLTIELPDALVEVVAERAAALVLERLRGERAEGRWLTGAKAAAEHLGCSPKRVYSRLHEIPHRRDGARLIFHTSELDKWMQGQ